MSLLVPHAELVALTGYKRGKEQCDWLRDHGWVFEVNSHGRPVVSMEYFRAKMGGQAPQQNKRWELKLA